VLSRGAAAKNGGNGTNGRSGRNGAEGEHAAGESETPRPLVQPLPPAVEISLRTCRNGSSENPLNVAVQTDIGANGQLGERWIVVDEQAVRVFSPNGDAAAHLDLDIPLNDLTDPKTETLVGGGALIARRGSDLVEIARFTTPLAGRMGNVARTISALSKGEDLPTVDEEDDRLCPTCGRPLPKDNDVCRFCINKTATMARLFSYAAPFKWHAVALVLLMFAGTGLGLAPGIIVKSLTDNVLVPTQPTTLDARYGLLALLVLALIGTNLFNALLTVVRGRLSAYLSGTITYNIRTQVHDRLQWLGLSYYDKRQVGALMTRVTQDVNELNNFLVDGLQILVVNGLTLLGILTILLLNNWRLTVLVLIPVPLVVIATRLTWRVLRRKFDRLWHLRSALSANLSATISGARVVKAFAQESREIDRFNARAESLYRTNVEVEYSWATIFPLIGFLMTTGSFVVWYLGGREVITGAITFGTLNMFLFFLGQLYGPLQGMTRIVDWLSRAATAAERVFEILDTEPDVKDAEEEPPVAMPHIVGEVVFENVSFGYDKARRVLENFDLHVQPGEMIGLVGHSGAGKTTVINLISRFYDPVEGSIRIDGVDLKRIKLHDLRRQLGIVLQEPYLFPGTVSENIAYANPDATREEIIRAAKAANAHDFIMRFPDGYDTHVGERGVKLSGGERQRLSIARAVLHNPRILILDEATASVDTETEKQIQEAIQRLISGRTTFAIAHRLSTLRHADRLVVVDKGKIAEVGTHDELMAKEGGIFRRLVEMQTEINKLRAY
jgi:ATP-binding cassette, subfamily B, bacterial